ncbi:hypothetical protein LHA35_09930 [Roseicella sp. GB24]|uniref:Transferase family hexapeptide repeat protein n=1 Tax=Roseicella aerolata TaxID=2883479 RepID=A0A9X1IFC1_9PROT|nr:hypothetical protein [Roseicella aerolata]MCB4822050.1 hypothetical protein [Roseicella aerolata]
MHALVDVRTREILDVGRGVIDIGPHVWLGRRSSILAGAQIGAGSIVGLGSVVTKGTIPPNSLAVGAPARVIREGITWSRAETHVDADATRYLDGGLW